MSIPLLGLSCMLEGPLSFQLAEERLCGLLLRLGREGDGDGGRGAILLLGRHPQFGDRQVSVEMKGDCRWAAEVERRVDNAEDRRKLLSVREWSNGRAERKVREWMKRKE